LKTYWHFNRDGKFIRIVATERDVSALIATDGFPRFVEVPPEPTYNPKQKYIERGRTDWLVISKTPERIAQEKADEDTETARLAELAWVKTKVTFLNELVQGTSTATRAEIEKDNARILRYVLKGLTNE
jgi:hypothetical protein